LKKRNKKEEAVSLPEETGTAENGNAVQETGDSGADVNRALPQDLSSAAGEEQPVAEPETVTLEQQAEAPAPEQETPLSENPAEEESPDKEEQAETASGEKTKKSSPVADVLRITLPLTVICIVVALMLAVVNMLTADRIAGNAAKERENAVREIFTQAETISELPSSGGAQVYLVTRGTELLGSCISLSENGFGGAISMMIGLDTSGSVCGVRIVSMSETPGFGTRAKNDSFLAGFRGRDPFVIGENFDALSGASVTSKAVVAGVNRALSLQPDLQAEAAQRGLTLAAAQPEIPEDKPAENVPSEETEEPQQEPEETDSVVAIVPPTPQDTTPAEEDAPAEAVVNLAAVMPTEIITFRSASVNRVTVVSDETVYVNESEEPVETEPVETEPVETEPVETEPVETESVETEPVETEPVETEPVETEPVETEPVETEPVETEPVETEPVETEPVETEPVETEPVETEPVETEPVETEPVETEPVETEPVETEPVETEPVETEPVETEPAETRPVASGV